MPSARVKIALIGTHGTGKTTLAHELIVSLKKQGIHAEFLGELARHCPLPINEQTTKESQEWIIYNQYIQELELQEKCDVLICDRSVLDGYVYYSNKFSRNKIIEEFIKEKINSYALLIKIPIQEGLLKKDGIRSTNTEFQSQIDNKFEQLLQKMNISFIRYENKEDIIEKIKKILKKTHKSL